MCMSKPYCDLVVIYPRPIFKWGMLPLEPKNGDAGRGKELGKKVDQY